MKRICLSLRHSRERGNPVDPGWNWVPAFAGMTMLLIALALSSVSPAQERLDAPYAYRQLENPAQEEQAQALMESLRCLQCQGQSIADSDAPMAGDMRSQVRLRIAAGEDPEAVRAWLVERYGDYVSYSPRLTGMTWPLFALPLVLIAFVVLLLRRRLRKGDAP